MKTKETISVSADAYVLSVLLQNPRYRSFYSHKSELKHLAMSLAPSITAGLTTPGL